MKLTVAARLREGLVLGAVALGCLGAVLTAELAPTTTVGTPAAAPAQAITYDGQDLHWTPAAWSCATVNFDVTYDDDQAPSWMTMQLCNTEHPLPDPALTRCTDEHWIIYGGPHAAVPRASRIIAQGTVTANCDN